MYKLIVLLLFSVVLTSCQPKETTQNFSDNPATTLATVLENKKIVALRTPNGLVILDPIRNISFEMPDVLKDEIPMKFSVSFLKPDPDAKAVYWYNPLKGIERLMLLSGERSLVYTPSSWFNTKPYFAFHPTEPLLFLMDTKGSELITIHLETLEKSVINVPQPFGTEFYISPDTQKIVFIEGFGQSKENPQYLVTDIKGTEIIKIVTKTEIADRHLITWLPDSSGVVVIENAHNLTVYPVNGDEPRLLASFQNERITFLTRMNTELYALTDVAIWHVVNAEGKEVGRIPQELAKEMKNMEFVPWHDNTFLIQESFNNDNLVFHRLWITDWHGKKTLLLPRYGDRQIIIEDTESVDDGL